MTFSSNKAFSILLFSAWGLFANPLELLKRHRYLEAVEQWSKQINIDKMDANGMRALKGQALAYQGLGSLYAEFHDFSMILMEEYYTSMSPDLKIPMAQIYLAQIQFYTGDMQGAQKSLQTALKSNDLTPSAKNMGEVYLYHVNRKLGAQAKPWAFSTEDNAAAWQSLELGGVAYGKIPANLKVVSPRSYRCRVQIYLSSEEIDIRELDKLLLPVLNAAHTPEVYFDKGKNTQINFYDPLLMATLSEGYFALAKATNLLILDNERRFRTLASRFGTDLALTEISLRLNQLDAAEKYLGNNRTPEGQILSARLLARQGKANEAEAILEKVGQGASPVIKREVAQAYLDHGLDLAKGLKWASEAARERNTPPYHRVWGGILLAQGKSEEAVARYSQGYKIEFRNRIDQIDPEFMAEYAHALFRTNKLRYEEVVETLYHLQREFPACRQMYYSMQGISAALARGYESQKIFRKGG